MNGFLADGIASMHILTNNCVTVQHYACIDMIDIFIAGNL